MITTRGIAVRLPLYRTVAAVLLTVGVPAAVAAPTAGPPDVVRLRHRGSVSSVAFSPDGKALATGNIDRGLHVWEASTGKELWRADEASAHGVAFSPDGKTVAAGGWEGVVRVFDAANGKSLREFPAEAEKDIYTLAFSPDGRALAVGGRGGRVAVYDAATGKAMNQLDGRGRIAAVVYSPDGRLLACATTGDRVTVWDSATGEEARPFRGKDLQGYAVAFSPDGRLLATGTGAGALCWREVATGEIVRSLRTGRVHSLAFSPDGLRLAAGGAGSAVKVWAVPTGEEVGGVSGPEAGVYSIRFSPDGRRLAFGTADKSAEVWDLAGRFKPAPPAAELAARELERLWADLAGDDVPGAYRAMASLGGATAKSVPFLAERLRSAVAVDAGRLAQWVKDLDSERFEVRQRAEVALGKLGKAGESALRRAGKAATSVQARRALERVLEAMAGEPPAGDWLRLLRAVAVMERAATPDARRVLEELAGGEPEAELTREARAALDRLKRTAGR